MRNEATIVLSRLPISRPGRNRFKVRIDGDVAGKIAVGEIQRFAVQPGSHTVQLRMGWAASRAVTVDVSSGGAISLNCAIRDDDMSPTRQMLDSIFGRSPFLELWQVQNDDRRDK